MSKKNPKKDESKMWSIVGTGVALIALAALFSFLIPSFEVHPLEGEIAPDFTMEILDGDPILLSDFRGESIVILDFWATWCTPCRISMPIIEGVAEDYADRGVKLFLINVDDPEDVLREFIEEYELEAPVALDRGMHISGAYQANRIPQTVLIDLDGRMHRIYMGVSRDLGARMRMDIDELLSRPRN